MTCNITGNLVRYLQYLTVVIYMVALAINTDANSLEFLTAKFNHLCNVTIQILHWLGPW